MARSTDPRADEPMMSSSRSRDLIAFSLSEIPCVCAMRVTPFVNVYCTPLVLGRYSQEGTGRDRGG